MIHQSHLQPARHVLVVDDDPDLREQMAGYLQDHGYELHAAADGAAMDKVLSRAPIELVILDLMLPGEDGLSICRRLAGGGRAPAILMMSGMADEVDRVIGLELGADDYLAKPCSPRELLARVRALLRRGAEARAAAEPSAGYAFLGFLADPARRQVRAPDGSTVLLSAGEAAMLKALLDAPGEVLSREALIDRSGVSGEAAGRAVDTQLCRLRRKLEGRAEGEIIRTVRGAGYLLDARVSRL